MEQERILKNYLHLDENNAGLQISNYNTSINSIAESKVLQLSFGSLMNQQVRC